MTGVRVEWCKAFARVQRWSEEVRLLQEEMRRTIVSLQHRATQWNSCVGVSNSWSAELTEGAHAYACSQADVSWNLANHFENLWSCSQHQDDATEESDIEEDEADDMEEEYYEDDDGTGEYLLTEV